MLSRAANECWIVRMEGYGWRLIAVAKTPEALYLIYRFRVGIDDCHHAIGSEHLLKGLGRDSDCVGSTGIGIEYDIVRRLAHAACIPFDTPRQAERALRRDVAYQQ